jgi:uncharacterized membrane protein
LGRRRPNDRYGEDQQTDWRYSGPQTPRRSEEARGTDESGAIILRNAIEYLASGVECGAALIIAAAALEAAITAIRLFFRPKAPPAEKNEVRLTLGRWLGVALEFELAADILNTAVTPTWNEIGKLAAIATLRTALNYFLQRDIDQESKLAQSGVERATVDTPTSVLDVK